MRKPNLLILAAWTLHVASWFLPVLKAQDYHEVVPGWRAFRLAACAIWPCEGMQFETLHHAVLATISVITTLFFLLCSPLVVLRESRVLQKSVAWAAAAAFAVNTHWIPMVVVVLAVGGLFMPRDEKKTDIPKAVAQDGAA